MKEVAFLKQNVEKWQQLEALLDSQDRIDPDRLAELFIAITDDLAYARTFFPGSKTESYLNGLARKIHQAIYRNRREDKNRLITFWSDELPRVMAESRKELLYSFLFFGLAIIIGALSAANDDLFVRLILGDRYVNMTEANIEKGDPMAVYKQISEVPMFLGITLNNIRVSFYAFAAGIVFSFGTVYILFSNGIMLGSFQYFFHQKGLLLESVLVIWIHGTLEISAIIIAGCAGLILGNSLIFPGTYSRGASLMQGAKKGLKIIVGIVPIFVVAGFLEGFVTRHTDMPMALSLFIIFGSLAFIIGYFVVYPIYLTRRDKSDPGNEPYSIS